MLYTGFGFAPWPGLVSVSESPEGGDPQSYYVDGRKTLNVSARETFAASIEALAFPVEFAPCAGRVMISPGLYADNQPRTLFGFSYRTLIGNDQQSDSLDYRVHLVYNATAKLGDFTHQSISGSANPESRSIDITTFPVVVPGYRPTSHFTFDTRLNDVVPLESIIYGDDTDDPRLPTVSELIGLLGA